MNTKGYHRPLKLPADRSARIARAVEADESCIAVGGLAGQLGYLRAPETPTEKSDVVEIAKTLPFSAGLAAIARIVQLARRERRQTPQQFANQANLTVDEVNALEAASVQHEPRVLYLLSEALSVSYQKLLTLAGHKKQRDTVLDQEVLRFAASSAPMDRLTKVEAQALHDFLKLLHD